jgi:hypothetical protein
MTRATDRAAAVVAITALSSFQAVHSGPRRALGGASPVCVVASRGLTASGAVRGGGPSILEGALSATIYVRADSGTEAAAEDSLDGLVRSVVLALAGAGFGEIRSDALPDGAPLRNVDGVFYRVERVQFSREEYT